jgi:LCP family protein required for cell wall assembly
MPDPRSPRNPALAATLSFIFPGLGQAYAGYPAMAALLAAPIVLVAVAAAVGFGVYGDAFRNNILSAQFLIGLLALNVVFLFWRAFAIGHAGLGLPRSGRFAIATVLFLIILTAAMHLYVAVVIDRLNVTLEQVFSGGQVGPRNIGAPPPPAQPLNRPEYRWDGTDRVNFLLVGIDSAPGREQELTDTILVISVDPVANTAAMISIPRDTGFMPLPSSAIYPDGLYPNKINQLATEASANREIWCPELSSAADCGLRTLQRSVGLYLGISIHYFAEVDLIGFTELIDALGGVELCLNGTLIDDQYTGPGWEGRGAELAPGCRRYDGAEALAYARIRLGTLILADGTREPQNDFLRADRQQRLLLALRAELADADLIFELPGTLAAIGRTVLTDFPRDKAGDLASLLPLITRSDVQRVVLGVPEFTDPPIDPEANYLLIPRREAIRALAMELFGPELEGWYLRNEPVPAESPFPESSAAALAGDES